MDLLMLGGEPGRARGLIRGLILLARVTCGDETPIRSGPSPKAKKKYLHVARTQALSAVHPTG